MILKCLNEAYADKPQFNELKELVSSSTVKIRKAPIVTRISIEPEQILVHKEDFNNRGQVYKDRCIANIQGFGNMILKHSFDEIETIKKQAKQNIHVDGFKKGRT